MNFDSKTELSWEDSVVHTFGPQYGKAARQNIKLFDHLGTKAPSLHVSAAQEKRRKINTSDSVR